MTSEDAPAGTRRGPGGNRSGEPADGSGLRSTELADALVDSYAAVTRRAAAWRPAEFLAPTRCAGWVRQDLLLHLMLDAQRALMTFATPVEAAPDRDFVTYWRTAPSAGGDDALAHARFVRRAAAAYAAPDGLSRHWQDTSEAAGRAARAAVAAGADRAVATQGHVLTVADFVATLVVEAAIHLLDLTVEPGAPGATGAEAADADLPGSAATVARRTLDGLAGGPPPARWSDRTYLLVATGRLPLDDADRVALGAASARYPLLG